jgi:hypothetical protein
MGRGSRFITVLVAVAAAIVLLVSLAPAALAMQFIPAKTVAAGETWVINETTRVNVLTVAEGATLTVPEGFALTLTASRVETGQALVTTAGLATALRPGVYSYAVLTVAQANMVPYYTSGPPGTPPSLAATFPFRQALYVDAAGVGEGKSVLDAVVGGRVTDAFANNVNITSTGENFAGIFVGGGTYAINDATISFTGNGRSDFIGTGAAIVGTGGATVVVDGADIRNRGVARPGIVADGGANVIVKNSHIHTYSGVLPADYVGTIDTLQMRSVPWMLGLSGNVRATNLLGTNTKASYINSYIASEGWGVLSTDGCTTPKLTAINSHIATGADGYGSYGIGDATERFLGCTFDVGTYATISRGSFLYYGDSDRAAVAQLNTDLGLGLTADELAALPEQKTVVNSDRFGIMWHGGGTLDISGGTVFNTKEATLLDKGQAITITVDGSEGAKLNPENHVIMQVMDDDDAGPNMAEGGATSNTYVEPTAPAEREADHNLYLADSTDAVATFSNITLAGDFYNSTRGGMVAGPFGPPSSSSKNLGLTFDNATITGVISASTATHTGHTTIPAADYRYLGAVTNTPAPSVNNGVIVSLTDGSKWIVTGSSYLTSLSLETGSSIGAPIGSSVSMTVNGQARLFRPGTYTGAIVLTVTPLTVFDGRFFAR